MNLSQQHKNINKCILIYMLYHDAIYNSYSLKQSKYSKMIKG